MKSRARNFFVIAFLVATQFAIAWFLPRFYEKKFTKDFVHAEIEAQAYRNTYLRIAKRSVNCSFISEGYFTCRGSYPEKNFKRFFSLILGNEYLGRLTRFAITIAGYTAFSFIIYGLLKKGDFFLKALILFVMLFSNPSMALIIFEPYTLLALGLVSMRCNSNLRTVANTFFATILNPVFSVVYVAAQRFISSDPKSNILQVLLALALGVFLNFVIAGVPDFLETRYFHFAGLILPVLLAQRGWSEDFVMILRLLFLAQVAAVMEYPVVYSMLIGWFVLGERLKQ